MASQKKFRRTRNGQAEEHEAKDTKEEESHEAKSKHGTMTTSHFLRQLHLGKPKGFALPSGTLCRHLALGGKPQEPGEDR